MRRGDHQSAYYIHWSQWEVRSFCRGVSDCIQILGYALAIYEKIKQSLIKGGCPKKKKKAFFWICSHTCTRCLRGLSNVHKLWPTRLDADFSGRASADECDKAAPLRPDCHASPLCMRLKSAQGSVQHLFIRIPSIHGPLRWGTCLTIDLYSYMCWDEFIYLQWGLWCDYYPTLCAGIVCLT